MCKVYLCKDRGNSWRVRVIDTVTKKKTDHLYRSEEDARHAMLELQRKYRRPVGVAGP